MIYDTLTPQRLALALVVALAAGGSGCAPLAQAQASGRAQALAAALAAQLEAVGADDPVFSSPEIGVLRGLLAETPAPPPPGEAPAVHGALTHQALALEGAPSWPTLAAPAEPPPGPLPPSVSYAMELGRFDNPFLAAAIWSELALSDPVATKGLVPRIAPGPRGGVRLLAGPFTDEDSVRGHCTAFAAMGVACAPAAFEGEAPAPAKKPAKAPA